MKAAAIFKCFFILKIVEGAVEEGGPVMGSSLMISLEHWFSARLY